MTRLELPVAMPMWALAELRISCAELQSLLGQPHSIKQGPSGAHTEEEAFWAYRLPSGQRIAIELRVAAHLATFYAEPPWISPMLVSLGFSPSDPRLTVFARPHLPI